MKYTFTGETKKINSKTLFRIKAVINFGKVRADDLGGFIESSDNLSQLGDCWIGPQASASDKSKVADNAQLMDEATIAQSARICDNACLNKKSYAGGRVIVDGESIITDSAHLEEDVYITEKSRVGGNTYISGSVLVKGSSSIWGNSILGDRVVFRGDAIMSGGRVEGDVMVENQAVLSDNCLVSGKVYIGGKTHICRNMVVNDNNYTTISGLFPFDIFILDNSLSTSVNNGVVQNSYISIGTFTHTIQEWQVILNKGIFIDACTTKSENDRLRKILMSLIHKINRSTSID